MDTARLPDDLLGYEEVCRRFGRVSRSYFYALKRRLPSYSFGGLRYSASDLEAHIAASRRDPPAPPTAPGCPSVRGRREIVPGMTEDELAERAGF